MSWLSDNTSLITGAWVSSAYAGHGILGLNVPSTGTNGASIITLATTVSTVKEYRLQILSLPAGFTLNEDGGGSYSGSVTGVAVMRLFEDAVEL